MMALEELRIARNSQWSKEPGKFNGKAVFKGERGEVSLNLNDHHIEQIFLTCAASIEEVAKAAAKFLHVEVENQRAPHGFDRMASHAAGRYVCECEAWQHQENNLMMSAYAEPQQSGAINQREPT